jgi:hypothetical protein
LTTVTIVFATAATVVAHYIVGPSSVRKKTLARDEEEEDITPSIPSSEQPPLRYGYLPDAAAPAAAVPYERVHDYVTDADEGEYDAGLAGTSGTTRHCV